uniref:Uncharacterized protein n=1 Tax=Parascaris equorum TaxID=6256 RepID=A0A914RS22_PAREQ
MCCSVQEMLGSRIKFEHFISMADVTAPRILLICVERKQSYGTVMLV